VLRFPTAMDKLIRELCKLPSIGEKSATRLAYHLVAQDPKLASNLASVLAQVSSSIRLCERCFFLAESELCSICSDSNRNSSLLCVVEKPMDMIAIEKVGEYRGQYHVLHGLWAPLRGMGPEDIRLAELIERIKTGEIEEVILATSSTVEGDATAMYISRILAESGVKASRLAQGLPKGGELEYTDEITLARAFSGRSVMNG
jgi:recombination protein RecR